MDINKYFYWVKKVTVKFQVNSRTSMHENPYHVQWEYSCMRIPTVDNGKTHVWESPPPAMGTLMHENPHHMQWECSFMRISTMCSENTNAWKSSHRQWERSCMRIPTMCNGDAHAWENPHHRQGEHSYVHCVIFTTTLDHRWHYCSDEEMRQRSDSRKEYISTMCQSQEVYCRP